MASKPKRYLPLLTKGQLELHQKANARRRMVETKMLEGVFSVAELLASVKAQGFPDSEYKDIEHDVEFIRKEWRDARQGRAEDARAIHEAVLWGIFNKQAQEGKWDEARKTSESIRKLNGDDAPLKTENTTEHEFTLGWCLEESKPNADRLKDAD